jgi:hypothetical protein
VTRPETPPRQPRAKKANLKQAGEKLKDTAKK